jgi:hypothetical protein
MLDASRVKDRSVLTTTISGLTLPTSAIEERGVGVGRAVDAGLGFLLAFDAMLPSLLS